eukprot:TRINITY_DN4985_c0_g3_i1.p1 TRINITY_DN4985_c0_g3~~TRINITY_DN4985_c0_g3_i1.p1  ORF type:complete len:537 (+),score=92.45 TRINITY_DN4985_c0_g3_i1:42-1613(+)
MLNDDGPSMEEVFADWQSRFSLPCPKSQSIKETKQASRNQRELGPSLEGIYADLCLCVGDPGQIEFITQEGLENRAEEKEEKEEEEASEFIEEVVYPVRLEKGACAMVGSWVTELKKYEQKPRHERIKWAAERILHKEDKLAVLPVRAFPSDPLLLRAFIFEGNLLAVSQLLHTPYHPRYREAAALLQSVILKGSLPSVTITVDFLVGSSRVMVVSSNSYVMQNSLLTELPGPRTEGVVVEVKEQLAGEVVAVGDTHGCLANVEVILESVEASIGSERLAAAHLVFLGDMVDRGPHTPQLIDYLIHLRDTRAPGRTHFIFGNHDFALCAFLGMGIPEGLDMRGLVHDYTGFELWSGVGWEGLHLQGRRYAAPGRDHYSSRATFMQYGAQYGDREGLLDAMPEGHKEFLRNLSMVLEHEQYVFVHGGIRQNRANSWGHLDPEAQLEELRRLPYHHPWLEPLSSRSFPDTPAIPGKKTVTGHVTLIEGKIGNHTIKIDTCGGHPGSNLTAVLLPDEVLITPVESE